MIDPDWFEDYKDRRIFAKVPWYRQVENIVLAACIAGVFLAVALAWARADAKNEEQPCKTLIWEGRIGTESSGVLRTNAAGVYVCEVIRGR